MKMRLLTSLLTLLLFLCMAHPCFSSSGRETVVVYKGGQTGVIYKEDNGTITKRHPLGFCVPAFVGGIVNKKEFLVVLSGARNSRTSGNSVIEAAARTSYGDYKTWSDAESVARHTWKSTANSIVGDVTAVMKENKIYVLDSSCDGLNTPWFYLKDNTGWDPLMIVGTVTNMTESNGSIGVYVKWNKKTSLKNLLPDTVFGSKGFRFVGGVGNGIVAKNGTIIFPIQIVNDKKEYSASIMYSTDDGSSWHMGGTTGRGSSECSVTEWGDGKLLLSARYDGGFRLIYESNDMGATWKESLMFSRVWGNQQDRKGVGSQGSLITVPVDGKDVLLFSHPLNKKGGLNRDTLQLWMSDGRRIVCVGTISEDGKEERSAHSILAHVGDNLYIVHEVNPYGDWKHQSSTIKWWDGYIALNQLPDLFKIVTNRVRAWRRLDKQLQEIDVATNGLVGFLENNKNNTVWEDKYNCVHATVNGATQVPGGFTFDGKEGSGAQWPVESQGQNQVYIFTEKQFTLAATVTIYSTVVTEEQFLLGARVNAAGRMVFIGIGYTKDNRWSFGDANGMIVTTGVSFKPEKEYHVAITFESGTVSVYVNGVFIINWEKINYESFSISHFFMGGIGKYSTEKGCFCTVKNVMLFNRVLNNSEIDGIKNVGKNMNKTKSILMTILKDMVFGSKTITTMDPKKETADPSSHMIPDEDESDNEEINAFLTSAGSTDNNKSDSEGLEKDCDDLQHHSNDRDFKEEETHIDRARVPFSFTTWLCFFCFALGLAWF